MAIDDTGWQKPKIVETPNGPAGVIQPATGIEKRPCFTCKHWDNDQRRLMQHLQAQGLIPDAEGYYETPIAQDFQGRRSLRIHPRDHGYCRLQGCVSDMEATCPDWEATVYRWDLARKLRR